MLLEVTLDSVGHRPKTDMEIEVGLVDKREEISGGEGTQEKVIGVNRIKIYYIIL